MSTTANGEVSLYYETFGADDDPVLLLVNGLGSQCINFKAEFCAKFADRGFRVVRFDNRDVGLSSHLKGGPHYTVDDMAQDGFAVLDAAGAAAATTRDEAAERYLAGLKLWGSPACFDVDRITADAHAAYDRCWDPGGRARQARAIGASPSREAVLGSLRVPSLVVHGDADRLVPPENGRATAAAIPGSRLEIVEGMGHDYPPQYWDRLVALITTHAQAAAAAS